MTMSNSEHNELRKSLDELHERVKGMLGDPSSITEKAVTHIAEAIQTLKNGLGISEGISESDIWTDGLPVGLPVPLSEADHTLPTAVPTSEVLTVATPATLDWSSVLYRDDGAG